MTTRPTMRSTLATYDITPRLYRTYSTEQLQRILERYQVWLAGEPGEYERALCEQRISQLERELNRREQ